MKKRLLFLCSGNSCRSQMAEGWLRHLAGERAQVASAGTQPAGLHPWAVRVMAQAGVDIAGQRSQRLDDYLADEFDYVITVCDSAREACPVFPGGRMVHWNFDDPAGAPGSQAERLAVFRRVRDEISQRLQRFIEAEGI